MNSNRFLTRLAIVAASFSTCFAMAQTGSIQEPVRYVGGVSVDLQHHEAGLRPAIGTHSHQVLRVNRSHPKQAEGTGWTYNHASNIAYWNDTFYVQYLSNPMDEHIAPGHTLMATSKDGVTWEKPEVVFPPYEPPPNTMMPVGSHGYMMHQRMGFYVAPNGRLLVLAFYGHAEDPFLKGGIGRVVREAYKDGTYGPIYFIRYTSHMDWNETNTSFPFYTTSDDAGFQEACNALLADKLVTRQWYDEDHGLDGFHQPMGEEEYEAFSYYTRKDGKLVGLWKWSYAALSDDGGTTFSKPAKVNTFVMAGGKRFGTKPDDGRYAILYNPTVHNEHRYPLAVVSSDDGIIYDDLLNVQSEVPPRRFYGRWKDFGPCYVRGIIPGNGNPPGDDLWGSYSMNKEDIWVSRVPVPIRHAVAGPIEDDFESRPLGGRVEGWNLYSPQWAPVTVAEGGGGQVLRLADKEPHDYARAVRVFQEGTSATIAFTMTASQANAQLDIDIQDRYGNRPVRLRFDTDGQLKYVDGSEAKNILAYRPGTTYAFELVIDAQPFGGYSLKVDGKTITEKAQLAEAVLSVERISFRTGAFRDTPTRQTVNETPHPPLPGADEPVKEAVFDVDDVVLAGE
ncbi:MAG: exo-alpha-sialidase [Candidatus Hydrogenedentes bacterium]|nr:exo-alpha-sialidase [Candidatus Hydrogenedentota bacterium]